MYLVAGRPGAGGPGTAVEPSTARGLTLHEASVALAFDLFVVGRRCVWRMCVIC